MCSSSAATTTIAVTDFPYLIECAFTHDKNVYWLPVPAAGLLAKHLSRALKARFGMDGKLCDVRGKPSAEDAEDLVILRPEPALTPYGGNEWVRPGTAVRLLRCPKIQPVPPFFSAAPSHQDAAPSSPSRPRPLAPRKLWRALFRSEHDAGHSSPGTPSSISTTSASSMTSVSSAPPIAAFEELDELLDFPSASAATSLLPEPPLSAAVVVVDRVPWLSVDDNVVNIYIEASCLNHREGYAAILLQAAHTIKHHAPHTRRFMTFPGTASAAEVELKACTAALLLVRDVLPAYPGLRYVRLYIMSTCAVVLLNKYVVPSVAKDVSLQFAPGRGTLGSHAAALNAVVSDICKQCVVAAQWDSYGHGQSSDNRLRAWMVRMVRARR